MSVDSLKIDYDEDTHQITIDWDKNDPNWSFLNNMSEEEIQQILITSLEELVDEDESD
jgi:hypothetical protein|tara:strand:+ start:1686 stop:1859 length:174 start_codon:yes stop_codon:yes gene_type:complete